MKTPSLRTSIEIPALKPVIVARSTRGVQAAPVRRIEPGVQKSDARLSKAERLEICHACEASKSVIGVLVCTKCGCICKFKTAIPAEKCPLGKW